MYQIRRQVRKAQRHLGLERFLKVLGWSCFASLLIAVGLIVVYTFFLPLGWDAAFGGPVTLGLTILGLAATTGFLAAWLWAVVRGQAAVDAALEIDRRYGLKERVSSALTLSAEDRQTARTHAGMPRERYHDS